MDYNDISRSTKQAGRVALSLLLIIIGLVVLTSGAAVGGTYFYMSRMDPTPGVAKKKPAPPKEPTFVKIDPFTINLADNSGRVLYIGLTLQVADAGVAKRIKTRMPQVRNRILITLADEKAKTLTTRHGKKALSAALRDAIRTPYSAHGQTLAINRVLFTDFIVQ